RLDYVTHKRIGGMGNVNKVSGRVKIDWTASENLDVLLTLSATRVREEGWTRRVLAYNANLGLVHLLSKFLNPPYGNDFLKGLNIYQSYATGPNSNDSDARDVALTATWDLGGMTLKSTSSYRHVTVDAGVDPDGTIYDIINQQNHWNQKQFTQEFLLSGTSFEDRLNWVMGLYYYSEKMHYFVKTLVLEPLWKLFGADLGGSRIVSQNIKSYAGFGQATYALTDKLSMTAGLRYTYETKNLARKGFRSHTGVENIPYGEMGASYHSFSPRFGLEYQWNPSLMTYVSAAQGFKSGGINGRSMKSNDFLPFGPETVWTYEVGVKSEWFNHRLLFNGDVFYSNYNDIQFQSLTSDPKTAQPISIIDNAGKAKIKGFEIQLKAVVAEGLTLITNVGYTHARYTYVKPTVPISVNNRFPEVPEWTLTLAANYTTEIGDYGRLSSRIDWAFRSKVFHDATNSPSIVQDKYGLINMRLSFQPGDGDWTIAAFVTNLTDKEYIKGGTDFLAGLGFAEGQIGQPREWGASVQYKF
ncbi:MAG: TonB-dependent receptor, partial [Alphaproteobacteria bacterium]|nr:TonB-dependent receptor [Alphaproteobacteria bacterium]